jgi:hypothetical protein
MAELEINAKKLVEFLQGLVKIAYHFGQDTQNRVHELSSYFFEQKISIEDYSRQVAILFRKPETEANILTILQGFANLQHPQMEEKREKKRKRSEE